MRTDARLLIALLLAVMTTLAAVKALTPDRSKPANISSSEALFAASFPDASGKMQPLGQWRNRVLVVNFWATWCPPCREEMPELSGLQEKYQSGGLTVIGLATDDVDKMRESAQKNPLAYPLLAGDFEAASLAASLGNDKNVLPYTVVIGQDGMVVATYFGRLDMRVLEQVLQPLLSISR